MSDVEQPVSGQDARRIVVGRCESDREWDDLLERSPGATVFHRSTVLNALDRHTPGTLHRLVGYAGSDPVGVFPVFERSRGGFTAAFSPPPRRGLSFQGPAVFADGRPQLAFERLNERFVDACLAWIGAELDPHYERYCPPPAYADARPFERRGYALTPQYTYVVDLEPDRSSIKRSFSRTPRRNVEENDGVEVDTGALEAIGFVHRQVSARYDAQGRTYAVPRAFLRTLYELDDDGVVTPYLATLEGRPVAGLLALFGDRTAYFSEGGGKPDVDVPVNDRLHWRVMRDAKARGLTAYDLQGANTPRICAYKSKFNPAVRRYYEIERGTSVATLAARLYRSLR